MKKIIVIIAFASLAITACKKNEKAEILKNEDLVELKDNPRNGMNQNAPAPSITQEDLLKEAQSKPLTNLVLSENHFDFGKIKKGEKVQHIYEVTNTGKNPLIISNVKPGCGCTAPEYTKDPIMPGKKGKITLSFDSTNFDGLVNKQAEVYANVEKAPIMITFSADIQPN